MQTGEDGREKQTHSTPCFLIWAEKFEPRSARPVRCDWVAGHDSRTCGSYPRS